ncbi:MAG: L,D-transpeptidase family protein [Erythrobacter sp.]
MRHASLAANLMVAACLIGCTEPPPWPVQAASSAEPAPRFETGRVSLSREDQQRAATARLLPGDARSLLAQEPMRHGDFAWNEEGVPEGRVTIWVDLKRQSVSVFRAGHEIGTAVILYGAPSHASPRGTFPILRKTADYHSRSYDAPMPHSLFLTEDGVALHGSDVEVRKATHGCIGLPEAFAAKLFDVAEIGDEVTIVQSDSTV